LVVIAHTRFVLGDRFQDDADKICYDIFECGDIHMMFIDYLKKLFDRLPIEKKSRHVFNLPNTITMLRMCVIPALFFLLMAPERIGSLVIAFFFMVAALTDFLDGYIARKYEIVTTMGKYLDPLADKLIVNTAMIMMIPIGRVPAWIVAVTVLRDLVVDGIRTISSAEGFVIEASRLGKQKTIAQGFAVTALIIHYPFLGADAHIVGMVMLYISLFLAIYSGIEYFLRFYREVIVK
jgi:CDP-diacylglycerol---glycerol-3-phosphate 3-phosphatidyltransferase